MLYTALVVMRFCFAWSEQKLRTDISNKHCLEALAFQLGCSNAYVVLMVIQNLLKGWILQNENGLNEDDNCEDDDCGGEFHLTPPSLSLFNLSIWYIYTIHLI